MEGIDACYFNLYKVTSTSEVGALQQWWYGMVGNNSCPYLFCTSTIRSIRQSTDS